MKTNRKSQLMLGLGGLAIVLLLAAVFTLGSLTLPFEPRRWDQVLVLYALSTFIVAALLVFGLILTRSLLRLWAERRAHRPGSRLKSKMVMGAMAVSFLPVVFLFLVSYALLNRTLVLWFPRPLEVATQSSRELIDEMSRSDHDQMTRIAREVSFAVERAPHRAKPNWASLSFARGADLAWTLNRKGHPIEVAANPSLKFATERTAGEKATSPGPPTLVRSMANGAELWEFHGKYFLAGRALFGAGTLLEGRNVPDDFAIRIRTIETQTLAYGLQRQQLRTYKTQMLLTLLLFTILLMFSATWFALFLSKQVTVPIQALAEATQKIAGGNFNARVNVQARDELETLVRSFNRMTEQLGDSRRQIDEFTQNLQQAVQELERRRTLIETILENIPTGVISVDANGAIGRVNSAAMRMFAENADRAITLVQLMGEQAARAVQALMRRSLRMGTATHEFEFTVGGRLLHAAVTVSSLGPRRSNPGFVIVVDDLTDLLRAQKAAAWQEVAQRIAHEIKNPLTPIQLSAQRLNRYLDRTHRDLARGEPQAPPELLRLVGECAGLIEREVATLESLVGEFSQFARFPSARLSVANPNTIVADALAIFEGRLEGIKIRKQLAPDLPAVRADCELLRRVVVNLIDNAAEAMEGSAVKELTVQTNLNLDRETVQIIVADSGYGISPADKDKLFLPHFSTKGRGTGLGLAIASRIMAEHNGSICVEDNSPVGAKFILQLPVTEVAAAPVASSTA